MQEKARNSPKRATIVIADDSREWRVRVREILLARPEWQVADEAGDGFEAVQKAIELLPDLVLLDIGMPVMNGLQAAEGIRKATPVPKIVFLTQNNDTELRSAALNAGAEGYVLKVNAATELFSAIETALNNGHRRNQTGTFP